MFLLKSQVLPQRKKMVRAAVKIIFLGSILALVCIGCKKQKSEDELPAKSFPKGDPQKLTYENVSMLIEDMQRFHKALKPLDTNRAKSVDDRYKGVFFELQEKPLFLNVYADPPNKRIVFLIAPKDPATGENFLLKFDKNLPVVNMNTAEIQLRLKDNEAPLTCLLSHQDPDGYVQEVQSHLFTVKYKLYKKFLQSGSFDFDALTIPTYRKHAYPFIVFDLDEAELSDTTAKLNCKCSQIPM
jgi:hypothetical protein